MKTHHITLIVLALFSLNFTYAQRFTTTSRHVERTINRCETPRRTITRTSFIRPNIIPPIRRSRTFVRRNRPVQVVQISTVDLVYDRFGNPMNVVNQIQYRPMPQTIFNRPICRRPVQRVVYTNPRVCIQKRRY